MFWRRTRKDSGGGVANALSKDGDMDLAKLQRQFGIQTVSDKDVEAEFMQLLEKSGCGAATSGSALGLSPRSELALFGGGANDSDEEAQILRQLNLSGDLDSIDVDALSGGEDGDDDGDGHDESDGAKLAKRELRGVLDDTHREAKRNAAKNDPLVPTAPPRATAEKTATDTDTLRERIHEMKLQAVAFKREGKMQEAVAVFRELKILEAQLVSNDGGSRVAQTVVQTSASSIQSNGFSVVANEQRSTQTLTHMGDNDVDDKDVEVTDEDMDNPEYLAQLAMLGFPVAAKETKAAAPVKTVETLERAIHETKEKTVELKRSGRIAEALVELRKIKELESRLVELRASTSNSVMSTAPIAPPVFVPSQVITELPEASNDSDVEVTDDDMNDPAFAAEIHKLGFDTTQMGNNDDAGDDSGETKTESEATPPPVVPAQSNPPASINALSYANRYSSVDDSDLIDEFEDDDDEEKHEEASSIPDDTGEQSSSSRLSEEDKATEMHAPSGQTPSAAFVVTEIAQVSVAEPSFGLSIEDLEAQLKKTKLLTVQLKQQNNVQAALDMMRRVKQIENLIEMKRRQSSALPVVSPEEQERKRKFGELEALLVQFANDATREAKEQLPVDRTKAAEWLSRRKEYSAHLEVLREKRRVPHQQPPFFRVEQISQQVEVERTDVPVDEVHMRVESVNELSQAAGKDVIVKFNLSFPSSAPHEGKTGAFRISSAPPHSGRVTSENSFRVKVQRGRGTQRLFEIKKAVFEVWRPGSLLRNPELIARGYQELVPLLTTSELKTRVVFVGSNRKPTGGNVEVSLRLRTPLRDKEYNTIVTEILRVGDYLPPKAPVPVNQTLTRPTARSEPLSPTPAPHVRLHSQSEVYARVSTSVDGPTASMLPRGASAPAPFRAAEVPSEVNASILEDPHNLDLIVSYDVINDEIQRIEAALPSLQGEDAAEYSDRLDSLGLKKQLLEIDMQTGKLTLDSYVARLNQRILDDRAIIKGLMKSGRKRDAARVLHRVKVMEKELESAEDDGQDGVEE